MAYRPTPQEAACGKLVVDCRHFECEVVEVLKLRFNERSYLTDYYFTAAGSKVQSLIVHERGSREGQQGEAWAELSKWCLIACRPHTVFLSQTSWLCRLRPLSLLDAAVSLTATFAVEP